MKDPIALLITGISALAAAFGVLYAAWRKDQKQHSIEIKEMHNETMKQAKEFTDATLKMAEASNNMSNSTDKVAEAVDKNTIVSNTTVNVLTELKGLFKQK